MKSWSQVIGITNICTTILFSIALASRTEKNSIVRPATTVGELAELSGYQRQTISMYENGKSTPIDISVIMNLSRILNFPPQFFTDQSVKLSSGSTYFRALLTTNKKYRNQQEQKMEFVAALYSFIQEYVDFPELNLPEIPCDVSPEEAAGILRKHWGLGDRPISNLIYTVEENGIIVTSFKTETDDVDAFSKMIEIEGEQRYFIGYSSNKTSAARIHFDVAHELGHICLHGWSEDVESLSKEEFKEREEQAHRFAAAFLLPESTFRRDVIAGPYSLPYYKQLKQKWKVSMAAMIRRAYTLNIISADDYQMLVRTMQRRSIWKNEPLDDVLITSEPSLLRTSVMMLLSEKVFTPKEFVDELSFDFGLSLYSEEIEHLLNLPENTLQVNRVLAFPKMMINKNSKEN